MPAKRTQKPSRCLITLLALGLCISSWSQKLVPDTLQLDFRGDSLINLGQISVPEIRDLRDEDPQFVSMTSKRKFLLIPVDREIHLRDSVSNAIHAFISVSPLGGPEYYLDLHRFEIIEKQNKVASVLTLVADIEVLVEEDDSLKTLGTLYYDYPFIPRGGKLSYVESCEELLYDWHTDFKLDLMTLQTIKAGGGMELTTNFITNQEVESVYLNARAGAFAGLKWHGFQAELYFSRPETRMQDRYTAGIIRYVNHPDYESIALGRKAGHYTLRATPKWLIDVDANVLMGFCKWKDIEASEPELYQMLDISLSSVQSLSYSPLNASGLTFRMGLMENFSYIVEKKPLFEIGLYGEIGCKF